MFKDYERPAAAVKVVFERVQKYVPISADLRRTREDAAAPPGGNGKIFGLAFVFALVMSLNLAMFLAAPDTTTAWGAAAGALAVIYVDAARARSSTARSQPASVAARS